MNRNTGSLRILVTSVLLSSFAVSLSAQEPAQISNGTPYESVVIIDFVPGQIQGEEVLKDVPPGKRLVIRNLTGQAHGPLGERYQLYLRAGIAIKPNLLYGIRYYVPVEGESFIHQFPAAIGRFDRDDPAETEFRKLQPHIWF